MNEITLKQSVDKKRLLLTFLVLFSLFISESVFARKYWFRERVQIDWGAKKQHIGIVAGVYVYSSGPKSETAFLEYCKFEASANDKDYYRLMEITTQQQSKSENTTLYLKNKLNRANIHFTNNLLLSDAAKWPDNSSSIIKVIVPTIGPIAVVALKWMVDKDNSDVRYIRISGKWHVVGVSESESFDNIVYDLNNPDQYMLKSNTSGVNTKVMENDPVKVYNESEAIVIKGAVLGANIKVYSTSGVEIKSVISNNDVVKIQVPANQIYLVHIGESRYKVAL